MIDGVQIIPLKTIMDERGMVRHMMKCTDPHFTQFGEIYFSVIYPYAIKAWHIHKKMTLHYTVISGNLKIVLFDARKDSPSYRELQEIFIGEDNYAMVIIPPYVVNGIKAIGNEKAILANCASIPHDPEEIERLHPFDKSIDYNWDIRHG